METVKSVGDWERSRGEYRSRIHPTSHDILRPPISHHSVCGVITKPPIISLWSSATVETCFVSVYHTHVHAEHAVNHGHEISTSHCGLQFIRIAHTRQ